VQGNNQVAIPFYEEKSLVERSHLPDAMETGTDRFDEVRRCEQPQRPPYLVCPGSGPTGPGASGYEFSGSSRGDVQVAKPSEDSGGVAIDEFGSAGSSLGIPADWRLGREEPMMLSSDLTGPAEAPGAYASVNGLRLYYEIHGQGPPLILLHGGLLTLDLTFGPLVRVLAEEHQVIGVELQGHGHTADIDRPMALGALADDVAQLLDHLGLDKADIFGFSLGGLVAMTLALEHSSRVNRLVVASVDHRPDHAEMLRPDDPDMAGRLPTAADFQAWQDAYRRVAPLPSAFTRVAEKTSSMVAALVGWTDAELAALTVPVLIVVGDTDFVPVDHAVEMFHLLPQAELCVLPGTTHMEVTRRPAQLLAAVQPFLA
jgi:pimeloyl-ACP methyl ester carboxylesterase